MNKNKSKEYDFCHFAIKPDGARVIREVTNSCNYSCSYCIFSSARGNTRHDVSTSGMKQALTQMRESGVKHLKITGGEPFVRDDLCELLHHAATLGFRLDISSNGSFLTEKKILSLPREAIDYMHISLDGSTKEMQEVVRGNATFEPSTKGIAKLIAHRFPVRVGTIIHAKNEYHLQDIIDFVIGLGVSYIVFSYMEPVGNMRGHDDSPLLATRSADDLITEITHLQSLYTNKIRIEHAIIEEIHEIGEKGCNLCPGGDLFLSLDHKGRLSPCTRIAEYFTEYISNESLHTHSYSSLLHSSAMKQYIHDLQERKQYGLVGCPKKHRHSIYEMKTIKKFFHGGREHTIQKKYTPTSAIYPFTTENIAGYITTLVQSGDSVLTIGGSGDHMLNAYRAGAQQVTNIDKNLFAKYYAELKWYAMIHLSYTDFIAFFTTKQKEKCLCYTTYLSLIDHLSAECRYFRDMLYTLFTYTGYALRTSPIFYTSYETSDSAIAFNAYLATEQDYQKTQDIICHMKFDRQTASFESYIPTTSVDCILTSNISDYLTHIYPHDTILSYTTTRKNNYLPKLTHHGRVQLAYIYADNSDRHRDISQELQIAYANKQHISISTALHGVSGKNDTVIYSYKKDDEVTRSHGI